MRSFFFNDTATTEIYTLSLHDALPISPREGRFRGGRRFDRLTRTLATSTGRRGALRILGGGTTEGTTLEHLGSDRKSTRLNSSHANISYAVLLLYKKKCSTNHRHYR